QLAQLGEASVLNELSRYLSETTAIALVPPLVDDDWSSRPRTSHYAGRSRVSGHVIGAKRRRYIAEVGILCLAEEVKSSLRTVPGRARRTGEAAAGHVDVLGTGEIENLVVVLAPLQSNVPAKTRVLNWPQVERELRSGVANPRGV